MSTGWEGELVRLAPLDDARHLENGVRWLNDPEVTQWLLTGDMPLTRLAEREFFERTMKRDPNEVHFAIETLAGEHIGFSGLHNVNYRHGVAVTGSFIGNKQLWRQGYGTDAAQVRSRYAFEVLGLRMLLSSVLDGNERSLGMLKKAGYRECGRLPQRFWKRGAYRDEILLALDRDSWKEMVGAKQAAP